MLAILGGVPVRTKPWPRWPEHGPEEKAALERVLESRAWGGFPAPGVEARRFGSRFADYVGTRHAILAANGTVTLEVILRAMGVVAGDEVIVPSLTWIATAGAAAYVNAVPVFADVDPHTLCISPDAVEALVTNRTKAIIVVHLASGMADMDRLREIAKRRGLRLVEDCAHVHGAEWNGARAGAIGDAGSFSFQSSKLVTAGEGGAITTNDPEIAARCQALVNCGRKEPGYDAFEGPVFGWNDRITEFQAALLVEQLARVEEQHARRLGNVAHFERRIAELGDEFGLVFQHRDARITRPTFYQVVLLYDAARWRGLSRDRFVAALEAEGVPVDGDFYRPIPERVDEIFPLCAREYPNTRERYGDALRPEAVRCPVASEAAQRRTLWFHHALFLGTTRDVDDIVDAIIRIREELHAIL